MQPKARIKLTLACDKACPYCINHDKAYRKRWKTLRDVGETSVQWYHYRTIIISGGEPTLDLRLRSVCRGLRIFAGDGPMIYLQTNGSGLTKQLVTDPDVDYSIDGIGLSIHDVEEFRHKLPRWLDIVKVKPIRLYLMHQDYPKVGEVLDNARIPREMFQWRVWEEGCLDHSEDVFLMDDWENNIRPSTKNEEV
jgi:hypothetical protein